MSAVEVMELRAPAKAEQAPLRLSQRPDLRPGPGEVRLRVEACAVCRTDLQITSGDLPAKTLPIVPGHQIVGRVEELGVGVSQVLRGRRLGVGWLASTCGRCELCRTGQENLCRQAKFTGWDRDGGFASQVVVRANFAQQLPEDGDPAELAPLLCGGVIGYRAFRLTGVGRGDRLGLFGFGASALLVAQLAIAEGCELFVVTRNNSARQRAKELGAEWVGAPDEDPPLPLRAAITFAPVGAVVVDALRALDRGGTCVVNAIHLDRIPEFPYELLYWERRLLSVANFTRQDAAEFLQLAQQIPVRALVERIPLTDANSALVQVQAGGVSRVAVLVP
ncbi:MAG TPA: zinc-dependent alcohol dehydrogenase family protein [Candidatus Acidoferrales bacterium]|nr:zinc-dependent alcohol dehydrogenase family protein [Candidatus Acidoferrales bacterium]